MRKILIADDHPLFREALRGAVLRALPEATLLEAASVGALLEALDAHPQCELLLLDLNMPGANGFSALVHLRASHPAVPMVVVSAREDADTVRRALGHGAAGFIPKSADLGTMRARWSGSSMAGPGRRPTWSRRRWRRTRRAWRRPWPR